MPTTIVSFHAHPDDEALLTAGSLALAASRGSRVILAFATRGDAGDSDAERLRSPDGLGALRQAEAERSAEAIGAERVVFLDHLDSGHVVRPPGSYRPGSFCAAGEEEAASELASLLRDEGADLVTTYDRRGGYGHPDHLRVHTVGARAAEIAGTPALLEATFDRDLLRLAAQIAPTLGLDLPAELELGALEEWYSSPEEISLAVDVRSQLDRKRASMEAHASQTSSASGPFRSLAMFLALPDELFELAFGTEWFIDRSPAGSTVVATAFGAGP